MVWKNDIASRFAPFNDSERDPKQKEAYYEQAMLIVDLENGDKVSDTYCFSDVNSRSVAEDVAHIVETYILASAEVGHAGEILFKVYVPFPVRHR